ncbi:hypothetical protein TH61_02510 [Rufibacter sp. DG15C]|uniref:hypothetical protein n=1 Tax=Rufibacter sp. DG15C TaxID=1379909 RepID=UPI00078D0DA6|nr:hypothetical protein [Rufibacter sp. DG15C]AMM50278.1 hypothetical protein TH61_02510 [Rufibacter sp. DG15C]
MFKGFTPHYKSCILFLFFISFTLSAGARTTNDKEKKNAPKQTLRIELPRNSFDYAHSVFPLMDSTLLLITKKRDVGVGKNEVLFTKYNHQLKSVWESKAPQPNNTKLMFKAEERGRVYLLFSTSISDTKLILYQIDKQSGSFSLTEHFLHSPYVTLRDMQVLDRQVFLNALDKGQLAMLHLNPKEPEVRILPAVSGLARDLGEFRIDTLNKALELLITESQGIHARLQAKFMTAQGAPINTMIIKPKEMPITGQVLWPAKLTPGLTSQKLLLGTYGYKSDEFVQGLYSINMKGEMNYYDFGKLSHFYEYKSSPAAALRMKARALRNEAEGSAPIKQYRMVLHKVQPHPQGYALVGELFEPFVKSETQVEASGFLLSSTTTTTKSTIMYKYQHAFACVFDFNGNLLWDNSYKLPDNKRFSYGPSVRTAITPEGNMIMTYLSKSEIFYKKLQVNSTNSDRIPVQLPKETDKRVTSSQEDIQHWHGTNFIAYGFQRISSKKEASRTVFYLQKVAFE